MADYEFDPFDSKMHYLNRRNNTHSGSYYSAAWKKYCIRPSCIPITMIVILIVLVILLSRMPHEEDLTDIATVPVCHDPCIVTLVESIPEGMKYPKLEKKVSNPSVFTSWMELLDIAQRNIDIASSYWSLRSDDVSNKTSYPSAWQGETIFERLKKIGLSKKVSIRIAQSVPTHSQPDKDTQLLNKLGAATVRSLNFTRFLGNGILHTKMWIVDSKHFYIGSANLDWRSLTQVKELGVVVYNCSCLANDLSKIFDIYWYLGMPNATIPRHWPVAFNTNINSTSPVSINFNNTESSSVYLTSSPDQLCSNGRTTDIYGILHTINTARKFVYIAVMDYVPATLYTKSTSFWPVIDDVIREAAIVRSVEVRLLISWWEHSPRDMIAYLQSLTALSRIKGVSIESKIFVVPKYGKKIPYTRVNHNKYMVTDNTMYIGTSNWSADYFLWTGGVGFVLMPANASSAGAAQDTARQGLENVFMRDWTSPYAHPIDNITFSNL